jgi:hypothetical protein
MTKQLNVFVLFPEARPIHDFFHNADDFVEEASLRVFLSELTASIEWVYREKNAVSFYSVENVQRFLDNLEGFKDDYLFDPASKMGDILAEAYNWQKEQRQEQHCAYFIWHQQTAHIVVNHILPELAERQKHNPEQSFLLFNCRAGSFQSKMIAILKEMREDNQLLLLPTFNQVNNEQELYAWLIENRQKRNFNLNPKHGENGVGAHKGNKGDKVDPLLCSREEAQRLLKKAIGDTRRATELYNFDSQNQKFIVFKFENETPQNQYHGFHPNNQDEIPHDFKQLIQNIGQVNN